MKNRLTKKTPKFFRILRNIGLTLTAVAAAILSKETGIEMPEVIEQAAGYAATAGAITSIVSQCAVIDEPESKQVKE